MNGILLSKCTKLLVFIWLMSCNTEINSIEISCNIITTEIFLNTTQDNIEPITAVNKCSKDYHDVDVIKKCENFIDSNDSVTSFLLYTPVTNRFKNIAYWNVFCATCNGETEFEYWPTWTQLKNIDFVCKIYELEQLIKTAADELHQLTRNYIRDGLKLSSKLINSTELQCSTDENWPLNLLQFIIPCLTDQFRKSQQKRLDSCQYFKNSGRVCMKMRVIIEGMDFVFDKNNEIVLFDHSVNQEFIQGGYTVESGLDNVIYLCEKNDGTYKTFFRMVIVVIIFSIISLIIYLFLNFTKRYLQSFPNKIIYSYAIGLLVMYLLLLFVYFLFPFSCVIYYLAQFSWFFHFFWTMIMALEFCRLTYSTFRKRKVTVSAQRKRYFVYCIVGYGIPVALPVIYFLNLETEGNRCPSIPDHFGVPCLPVENSVAWYFIEDLAIIFFSSFFIVIPIVFVLQAGVLIYVTKCGPTQIRSTGSRNHLIILMKMGYIMGVHWVLYIFSVYYGYYNKNSVIIKTASNISQLSIGFQGVFVFLAYGFKKKWLKDILYKIGCNQKSTQQSSSAGTGTTVQFISNSVQISDSTGTKE